MEQRQDRQMHGLRRHQRRRPQIDGVPEGHAVGDHGALGQARRAGGVHDGREVVVRDVDRIHLAGGLGNPSLVGRRPIVAVDVDEMRDAAARLQLGRGLGEFIVIDENLGARVVDDELQLRHRQPPVQRQENGAQPATGELQFEMVGGVGRQDADPVAALDAQAVAQVAGEPAYARTELHVAELPPRMQIDRRRAIRGIPRVMRQPIVRLHRHNACLPTRFRQA